VDAGGVNRALGGAGTDQGMKLVDEEHHLAGGANLIEDLFQPLLKLAPVLRTGDQWAHVEGEHALVNERLGDVTKRDQLSQALCDRSLADARLADQGWVVLGPAAEDLDDALDLVLASDHRVERVLACELGEIATELVQKRRLRRLLGRLLRIFYGGALA